ncbi:hypothetical protein C8Q75DRAFT_805607 [Abortiporus biennis]|nr:hypothetical protein C8Q75DRAFT_805607 [Abortiporus biennis]
MSSTSRGNGQQPKIKVPQDLVAIFHASFHPTQGNIIDWSLKASEDFDISHVEFSCLPSGLHLIEEDVVYFTKDGHQGVCVFRRRQTSEHGHRGFRLSSLGIILAKSTRSRPWKHVPALKALVHSIYTSLENRAVLEPTEGDWEPAERFFEERKVKRADLGGAGDWDGWSAEFDASSVSTFGSRTNASDFNPSSPISASSSSSPSSSLPPPDPTPTLHLPHLLHILGPSTLTLYKHLLGRKRILIFTAPPVEVACILCHVAADMCLDDQIDYDQQQDDLISFDSSSPRPARKSTSTADTRRNSFKGKSKAGVSVLGMVTLNDLDRLTREDKSGRGWVACTTDALFLERPQYYDLLIDLTTASPPSGSNGRFARPTFYSPKIGGESTGSGRQRLSVVRFTWNDVKLWTEMDRILSSTTQPCCCSSLLSASASTLSASKQRSGAPNVGGALSSWTDMWKVYEDVCVLCAGIWMGSWRNSPSGGSPYAQNWGSIHLDGEDDDYISIRKSDDSYAYVRNFGMGIEGRRPEPTIGGVSSVGVHEQGSSSFNRRNTRSSRRTSGMSLWTWASGRNPAESPKDRTMMDEDSEEPDEASRLSYCLRRREQQTMTTLAVLQSFHRTTGHLIPKFKGIVSSKQSSNSRKVTFTAKDLLSLELSPLSGLDAKFVEWLGEEYGGGVEVNVRRTWRDLFGLVLGL